MDGAIFWGVVALRVLVPLAIPRFPLPAMLAALVIDGVDQTIFQTFTSLDLSGYQSYDKALDVYYLAIAYTASLRNWTNPGAFRVGRFLWYYRLVGVVLFELSQVRALLLVFPNTWEYFFDAYEAVRARWDPRRMSFRLVVGIAAFIWIVIKLPQEWWIHVAQLDMTDTIKTRVFGVPVTASWLDAVAARPLVLPAVVAVVVALGAAAWWVVTRRLPPADHPLTFDADRYEPPVDEAAIERERRRIASRLISRELAEKVVLLALISVIFGTMLPDITAPPLEIAAFVVALIVANTAISEVLVRRERGRDPVVVQFGVGLAINLGLVLAGSVVLRSLTGRELEHALLFAALVSLIVTLYDRYRPVYLARFSQEAADAAGAADPAG
jgi:hypothetical protein